VTGGATHVARLYSGPAATRMQGLYGGVLTLGGALGFVVVPAVTARTGWVGLHSVGAILAIPAAVALFVHARGSAVDHTRPATIADTTGTVDVREILGSPAVLVASICYVAVLSSYITLSTFVTTYFEEAGVLVSLNAIVLALAGVARVAGGVGAEWGQVDDTRTIAVSGVAGTAGFLGLAVAGHPLLIATLPMATMIAVSVPFGSIYNVAAGAEVGEGPGLGVVLAVGNLAALVFPAVTGAVRETTGSYGAAFALLAGANLVAVGAAVWLGRH
jgi:nitrate/nitrite transporter NarK